MLDTCTGRSEVGEEQCGSDVIGSVLFSLLASEAQAQAISRAHPWLSIMQGSSSRKAAGALTRCEDGRRHGWVGGLTSRPADVPQVARH